MTMQTLTGAELWGDPTRTNLIISSGTATEITFEKNVEFVYVSVPAGQEWQWVFAVDAATAATVLTAGTAVGVITNGYPIPVRGRVGKNLYVKSTGAAVTNGLSYWKASLSPAAPA